MADESISLNLPWRWESPPADKGLAVLVDSTGRTLIYGVGSEPGWVRVPIPYVLAVTERAGAMEKALRKTAARLRELEEHVNNREGSGTYEPDVEVVESEALLAEIDAAQKGG